MAPAPSMVALSRSAPLGTLLPGTAETSQCQCKKLPTVFRTFSHSLGRSLPVMATQRDG
ncbi:hypothetical protein EMIT0194P_100110 [Pseudomonas serbica]